MRKIKFAAMSVALALAFAVCNCCVNSAAATTEDSTTHTFSMEEVNFDWDFSIYQDSETGVQYIVYKESSYGGYSWFGMVPRYNADGTLYVGD